MTVQSSFLCRVYAAPGLNLARLWVAVLGFGIRVSRTLSQEFTYTLAILTLWCATPLDPTGTATSVDSSNDVCSGAL